MTVTAEPCLHEHPDSHGHQHQADGAPAGKHVRAAAVASGLVGASALTYVIMHDPTNGSLVPSCPVRAMTGLWCPGCGLTRSVHALGNGDPMKAFRLNLFVIPIMMSFGLLYGSWALRSFGFNVGNPAAWFAKRPVLIAGTITTLLLFSVIRNLPGLEFLIGQ